MKNKFITLFLVALTAFAFVACESDDDDNEVADGYTNQLIINYGNYGSVSSTISGYNADSSTLTTGYYEAINNTMMTSNIEHAYQFNDKIYFMGNDADQVFWVDSETFEQTENGVSTNIVKPRYCVGEGDYLYISCWGGDIWGDSTLSYIAKFNITSNTVEEKIMMEGGPEGLAIVDGKLYAALNYKKAIAVMDLSTQAITEIETDAATSFFVQDDSDNLYVTMVSTWGLTSYSTGLGYLNTTTDAIDTVYALSGISSSYTDIIVPNADFSKLYVVASAWVEESADNWVQQGAIASFDVEDKSFGANIAEGITGINGIGYSDNTLFYFVSPSVTDYGTVVVLDEDGTVNKEYETGIAPTQMITIE